MTEQDFLADILNNPSDDALRLVYADFLDGQGRGERAEFIRVQCRLAGLMQHKPSGTSVAVGRSPQIEWREEVNALRRRERELLGAASGLRRDDGCNTNKVAWSGDLTLWCQEIDFCRGFVHAIACNAVDWLTHADAILAVQPVEEVTLKTWPEHEMDPAFEATPYPRYRFPGRTIFTGPDEDYPDGPHTRAERLLILNWPQIKKWTLPPEYNVGPLVREAIRHMRNPPHFAR